MKEPKFETFSVDVLLDEIVVNRSEPITPRPPAPLLSEEEQAFADAVKRYRIDHLRGVLDWRDILEIVHSLGYRKVEPSAQPPGANGNPQDPADPDAAGNEKPS